MVRTTGSVRTTGTARSTILQPASAGAHTLAAAPITPGSSVLGSSLERLLFWFGEALTYAMGRPAEPGVSPPPLLGVQPYRDIPRRRR
jgi:hypothetical protein